MKTDMTSGERLWIYMRRFDMTNAFVAYYFGVPEAMVTDWLHDRPTAPAWWLPPAVMLKGGLMSHERLALARRRRGWTLREMARRLGMSHVTLIRRERGIGPLQPLLDWWEREGWPEAAGGG